jgi:hypothetical protein
MHRLNTAFQSIDYTNKQLNYSFVSSHCSKFHFISRNRARQSLSTLLACCISQSIGKCTDADFILVQSKESSCSNFCFHAPMTNVDIETVDFSHRSSLSRHENVTKRGVRARVYTCVYVYHRCKRPNQTRRRYSIVITRKRKARVISSKLIDLIQ